MIKAAWATKLKGQNLRGTELCRAFLANPTVNPATKRTIKKGAAVYNYWSTRCADRKIQAKRAKTAPKQPRQAAKKKRVNKATSPKKVKPKKKRTVHYMSSSDEEGYM